MTESMFVNVTSLAAAMSMLPVPVRMAVVTAGRVRELGVPPATVSDPVPSVLLAITDKGCTAMALLELRSAPATNRYDHEGDVEVSTLSVPVKPSVSEAANVRSPAERNVSTPGAPLNRH